jgi:tRNA A37 threonylcarbamoyltransferase TsaD
LVGGGVSANTTLRKMLRQMTRKSKLKIMFPYSGKLMGDNAAMIGVAAYYKALRKEFISPSKIDRSPNLKLA